MTAWDRFRRVSCCAGLTVLCLVAACSPEQDSGAGQAPEEPYAGIEPKGDGAAESDRPERGSTAGPPSRESALDAGEPAQRAQFDSYNAGDLLDELQALSWGEDPNASRQAARLLQRLRSQGAAALIPLRDALLDDRGADALPPQLRRALLDVLLSLDTPQVEGAALELLASHPSAIEAWQLGEYLEAVQPGRYSESIRLAAEQALIEAGTAEVLPGEFFLFLGGLGNEETALLLAELPPHQEVYGSLALTVVPNGLGLPLLAQEARAFQAGRDTVQGRLAIQLLAQQAAQFPEAAGVLIELAEQGAIPHDLWPYVLDIVAGSWELTVIKPPTPDLIGSHTYYGSEGDQVIYRAARLPGASEDGLQDRRLFLLDRLQPLAPPDLQPGSGG